jgi:hypothetical protein
MNWGTLPEWLSAIAFVASAVVVIWFAGLNRSYLKEASEQYARTNRQTASADFEEIRTLFDQASVVLSKRYSRVQQKAVRVYDDDEPDPTYLVMEAISKAQRILPDLSTSTLGPLGSATSVGAAFTLLNVLDFDERTDDRLQELHQELMDFNTQCNKFMEHLQTRLGLKR